MGLGLIGSIIIGGLAGWVASSVMKSGTGVLMNIVLGILGAVVLNALLGMVGIYADDAWLPQLLVGFVGACGLIFVWRKIR